MTYPKNGEQKLKETIKALKRQLSRLRKENDMLRNRLDHLDSGKTESKNQKIEPKKRVKEIKEEAVDKWREDFMERYKPKKTRKETLSGKRKTKAKTKKRKT